MLKAVAHLDGRRCLVLGLERVNVERLTDGGTISFDLERIVAQARDWDGGVQDVVLLYGATPDEVYGRIMAAVGEPELDARPEDVAR